jgi:hypothetical protein
MADSLELQTLAYIKSLNSGKGAKIDREDLSRKITGLQITSNNENKKDSFNRAKILTQNWLSGFAADATAETILHSASRLDDDGSIRNEDDGRKNLNEGNIDDDLAKLVRYENPPPIPDPDGSGGVIEQEPRPVKEDAIPSGITLDNNLEEKVSQTPWQMRRVMEDIIRDAVLGDSPKATEGDDWHNGGFGGGTYEIQDPNKRSIDGILGGVATTGTANPLNNQPQPAANTPPTVTVSPNTIPLTTTDANSKTLPLTGLLTATDDVTKEPENLTYTLGDIAGGEVKKDATALATGGKFTQKEIDDRKITFVWNGTESTPKFTSVPLTI